MSLNVVNIFGFVTRVSEVVLWSFTFIAQLLQSYFGELLFAQNSTAGFGLFVSIAVPVVWVWEGYLH